MTPDLILPSPAKLNLFLHIVGRREDGYHELQTLFQFLDYGDELIPERLHMVKDVVDSEDLPLRT